MDAGSIFVRYTMDRHNGTGKTPTTSAIPKPTFHDLYNFYHLEDDDLQSIAKLAGVTQNVVNKMFLSKPVEGEDAVAVLAALSQTVQATWTIDMMIVPILPEPEPESEAEP
jgi:hypothetical protein